MSDPGPSNLAKTILRNIPTQFSDDGCSNAPDGWLLILSSQRGLAWLKRFARSFRWCCRIHDWRYCTRCHPAGSMTRGAQRYADRELGWHVRSILPFGLRWWGWLYWRATNRFGGMSAWDSCGIRAGQFCRHNMPIPRWMEPCRDRSEDPSSGSTEFS